jgi:hypothetical protein
MSNKREALEAALSALESERIMAADAQGNYTVEVTPKRIQDAIAKVNAALAEPEQEPVDVLAMPDTALGRTWDIDRLIFRLSLTKNEDPSLVGACWTATAILVRIQKLGKLYTSPREWRELSGGEKPDGDDLVNGIAEQNYKPFPFCDGKGRYLQALTGHWTERVICDSCHFHLPPEKWEQRQAAIASREPMPLEKAEEFAHRTASRYTHKSDKGFTAYTFLPHTLEDFVRKIERFHGIGG